MEGWLINPETQWAYRFHRDEKSWIRDPMVFVDMGMEMPGDEPPLLKTRQRINKEAAKEKWVSLVVQKKRHFTRNLVYKVHWI